MAFNLTAQRGLLFRITHVDNLPWLLASGVPCPNSTVRDPNFTAIGNPDLISARAHCAVRLPPGGTLADYVPFYFTPKSVMLFNIKTGHNGVTRRANDDIAILVASCQSLAKHGVTLLFTDRHAYSAAAEWKTAQTDLEVLIDWDILRRHDFARDDYYPDKKERYQAEALAHRHVPLQALLGIGCASQSVAAAIGAQVAAVGLALRVVIRPEWYF